jgi:hypothetical protein
MSFATEVVKDGRGVVLKVDISLDEFSSISYRYSTRAGVDATNEYQARIVTPVGSLTRGLGDDNFLQASSFTLVLANDDEGVDWMVDRATSTNMLKARARLYLGLYDPASPTAASIQWKQLGEFVFVEFPERDDKTVRITMADDSFGFLAHPVSTPTIREWYDSDANPVTNPLRQYTVAQLLEPDAHLPLVFGCQQVRCGKVYEFPNIVPVLVTTSTAAVAATDVLSVTLHIKGAPPLLVPAFYGSGDFGGLQVYTVAKSQTISKDGRSWKVLYITFDVYVLTEFITVSLGWNSVGQNPKEADGELTYSEVYSVVDFISVIGYPNSSRTTSDEHQHAVDILQDLVEHYSYGSSANVNATSFARAKALTGDTARGLVGIIGGGVGNDDAPSLREHISNLCGSADIDCFIGWDGTVGVAGNTPDFTALTTVLTDLPEHRIRDVSDRIPSREERGAPFNRVVCVGGRPDILGNKPPTGPFDDPSGTIVTWGRVLSRQLNQSWRNFFTQSDPWTFRNLRAEARPKVSFTTDLEALLLEIGDYFQFNWTRNLGTSDPYTQTIFQIEEMSVNFADNSVRITALWIADTFGLNGAYLLDNEPYLTRTSGSDFANRARVVDDSTTVAFGASVDLIADDVQPGDTLILLDDTLAATDFTRYRALLIVSVDDVDLLTITDPDLDFGAPSIVNVEDWEIRRGDSTYHDSGSDPTNYPSNGDTYGRVADAETDGVYSSAFAAHTLQTG